MVLNGFECIHKMIIKAIQRERPLLSGKTRTHSLVQLIRYLSDTSDESPQESVISSFTTPQVDERPERVAKRPVSYMPDHLPQCRKWQRQKPWWKFRYFVTINSPDEQPRSEWSEEPEYPPLKDSSHDGVRRQIRMEWYDGIKRLPTAQQKEFEICKHFMHLGYILEPIPQQYNALPLQQFVTRTHLIRGHLPSLYDQMNVDSILDDQLKQSILDSIAFHLFETKQRKPSLEFKNSSLPALGFPNRDLRVNTAKQEDTIEDVLGIIRKTLQPKNEHLSRLQMDVNPFVCSSWWLRDFPAPFVKKRWFQIDPLDQQFTYRGTHSFHLRSEKPLPAVISLEDDICTKAEIPEFKYRLVKLGYHLTRQCFTQLSGFWSDHSNGFDFPNLICHSRQDLKQRELKNEKSFGDDQDIMDGMAISSSFAWLNSLASNLGFTVYHELTYPLVTHAIITDGQFWSFYVYQLNTHSFHSDVDNSSLRNVCWSSGDLKLFDAYENGRLVGVNDDVLKVLIKFLTREPQLSKDVVLRPYLSEDTRSQEDVEELSYLLRRRYSNWVDQWLKTRQKVHLWEEIYKYHKEATPLPHIRTRPKITFKYPPFFTK